MDLEDGFDVSQHERNVELQNFRERWRQELNGNCRGGDVVQLHSKVDEETKENPQDGARTKFEIAAEIFQEGIKEERAGRLYEAVRLYRQATQLDPDIDFKMEKYADTKADQTTHVENAAAIHDEGLEQDTAEDLLERLISFDVHQFGTCRPDAAISNSVHISALPFEILQYLTRWIVSADLDMLSLEQFSIVCRGFYKAARDDVVWKLACMKVWGLLCGKPDEFHYGSWRDMLIYRPQVRFNGVYIGRVSYVRPGEASFVDQNTHYLPWYNVTYYRYFRFFADGSILYANTPDEPLAVVPRLRSKQTGPGKDSSAQILPGYFRLTPDGQGLVVFVKRDLYRDEWLGRNRNRRGKKKDGTEKLVMELSIKNTRDRLHARLDWRRYTITRKTGNVETSSIVDLNMQFPSCYFSRVKSYLTVAEQPLV